MSVNFFVWFIIYSRLLYLFIEYDMVVIRDLSYGSHIFV